MSRIGALWVSHPTEMRSTPVSAIAGAVSGVTRPEASLIARPPIIATPRRRSSSDMLSSSTASTLAAERLFELGERVDLDLDLDEMADMGADAADRLGDGAGDGDVVVLDEGRVVEAEAMVGAAARAHRVFLDRAQERRRLAGADDARLGVRRPRPTSRAVALAIPLSRLTKLSATRSAVSTPRAGPSIDRDARAGATSRAVGERTLEADRRVDEAEGERGEIEAGDDALLPRSHDAPDGAVGRRDGVGRDVAGAAEVFQQRLADERLDEDRGQGNERHDQALLA